jgi:hypothetical protein
MDADARRLSAVYDALPMEFRALKVNQKRDLQTGGLQVIDALRHVFRGETFSALELYDDLILNQEIGQILADDPALVGNPQGSLWSNTEAAAPKLVHQRTFINLFDKSAAQSIRDLEGAAQDSFCDFIGVHLRPMI